MNFEKVLKAAFFSEYLREVFSEYLRVVFSERSVKNSKSRPYFLRLLNVYDEAFYDNTSYL